MKERDLPISYAAILIDVASQSGASREELLSSVELSLSSQPRGSRCFRCQRESSSQSR